MSATSSTSSSSLSGLASGIDWTNIVNELLTVEAAPETQMNTNISTDQAKSSAYSAIGTTLTTLGKDLTSLSDPSFFDSRTTSVADSSIASATAAEGTPLGNYTFDVIKLASDAVQQGKNAIAAPLNTTNGVSSAGFATPVTAGTFTVNGQTITIAATDTLQSVFAQINAKTGTVSGSYDAQTDEITLSSTGTTPIVLGSATDTSNFLQSAELYNNNSETVTSASGLGGVDLNASMSSANLATPLSDGGSGAGEFMINGVQINFNASTDSVNDVLQRINDSQAGVTATYDSVNDRFELTNKTTGDVGISLQYVSGAGNFLAATGLSSSGGGTLQHGTNLQYSINNGGTLTSQSNTIDATSAGVAGLSVTALGLGSTTISVNSDTSTISSTISSFVTDYNAVQTYISGQIKPSTDSSGNVTPGTLTGDLDAEGIADQLRQMVGNAPTGLSGGIQTLNDIGIVSNGTDNTLSLDTSTLNSALASNLASVKQLFTSSTNGIATTLNTYVTATNASNGMLANDENNMTTEITGINSSITALKQRISNDQTMLTNEFVAMETAINSINTQKQYLNDYFGGSSSSSQSAPVAAGSSSSSSSSAA